MTTAVQRGNEQTGRTGANTKARCSPPVSRPRPRFSRGELIHCQQTASVSVEAAAACFSRSRREQRGEGGIGSHRLDSGGRARAGGRDYCSFADNEGQASESGRPTEPLLTALCPRPSPAAFVTELLPPPSAAVLGRRPRPPRPPIRGRGNGRNRQTYHLTLAIIRGHWSERAATSGSSLSLSLSPLPPPKPRRPPVSCQRKKRDAFPKLRRLLCSFGR